MTNKTKNVQLISKLSLTTIGTTGKLLAAAKVSDPSITRLKLATIYGQAFGIKIKTNKDTGDVYESITGEFEAVNVINGNVYRSGILYLPDGIHQTVEGAVKALQNDNDSVTFALDIYAVPSTSPAGFAYSAESLIKAKKVDPLEEMRNQLFNTPSDVQPLLIENSHVQSPVNAPKTKNK
jgi:hypothetical protein